MSAKSISSAQITSILATKDHEGFEPKAKWRSGGQEVLTRRPWKAESECRTNVNAIVG